MAGKSEPKKVKYVRASDGAERYVREDNVAGDTAARFDGFQPASEAPKAKAAAPKTADAPKA